MDETEPCPRGLSQDAQQLWAAATAIVERGAAVGDLCVMLALDIRRQLRSEGRIHRLETRNACLQAKIQMACDRLGGLVEGRPTHSGNFLQRIDELVAMEKRVQAANPV